MLFIQSVIILLTYLISSATLFWEVLSYGRGSEQSELKVSANVCKSHQLPLHWPHLTTGCGSTPCRCLWGEREVTCNEQRCLILFYRKEEGAIANNNTTQYNICQGFSTEICQEFEILFPHDLTCYFCHCSLRLILTHLFTTSAIIAASLYGLLPTPHRHNLSRYILPLPPLNCLRKCLFGISSNGQLINSPSQGLSPFPASLLNHVPIPWNCTLDR